MRAVKEWIGKTDDSVPPPTVKARVFKTFGGVCQCGCTIKIATGMAWEADHKIPIAAGGANRETNLHPLLKAHHDEKTSREATERSKIYAVRNAHIGAKKKGGGWGYGKDSPYKKTIDGRIVLRKQKG